MHKEERDTMLRQNGYFFLIVLLLLFFFFYKAGLFKVILMTLAYIIFIHIPGLAWLFCLRDYDEYLIYLAPGMGFFNIAFFAYLFGTIGIHFKFSLIVSFLLPCVLAYLKLFKGRFKRSISENKIDKTSSDMTNMTNTSEQKD